MCFGTVLCYFLKFISSDDIEAFNVEDQQKVECIYDIIDHHGGSSSQRSVWLTGRVLHSHVFRGVIVVAIILDSVVVALETNATIVSCNSMLAQIKYRESVT